ncbi:hypothetical protein [Mycobacteroides abscessus]|uniref:hypothetical protein n=1 Tax=Mycobacteroides abscessus TaxID=36809 RepID=UPI0010542924|nr:hypothetical protein [Mycobacteroides abscessus]
MSFLAVGRLFVRGAVLGNGELPAKRLRDLVNAFRDVGVGLLTVSRPHLHRRGWIAAFHGLIEGFLASFGGVVDQALQDLGVVGCLVCGPGCTGVLIVVSAPQVGVLVVRGEQCVASFACQGLGELRPIGVLRSPDGVVQVPGYARVELMQFVEELDQAVRWTPASLDRHRERAFAELAGGVRGCTGGAAGFLGYSVSSLHCLMK